MNKVRLCLVNHRHGISSGVFFCRQYAEQDRAILEDEFPGTTWEIQSLSEGFRPDGFRHLGEHGVRRKLTSDCRESSNDPA